MPQARPKARSDLSRRALLTGVSAAPAAPKLAEIAVATGGTPDPTITICQQWFAVEAERQRLMLLWGRIEARLMKEHGWYDLSAEEQRAIPAGRRLSEISTHLDVLFEEHEALLEALPSGPAPSVAVIIAKLSVAERLIFEEDHPVVHDVIAQSIRDLTTLYSAT